MQFDDVLSVRHFLLTTKGEMGDEGVEVRGDGWRGRMEVRK